MKRVLASAGLVIRAIVVGLLIALVGGSTPFALAVKYNAEYYPEVPWVAALNLVLALLLFAWLAGLGPAHSSSACRNHSFRLWRPPASPAPGGSAVTYLIAGLIVAIYAYYIIVATFLFGPRPLPDLSAYPTTAIRLSLFVMGALMSGVGEEIAFRGYIKVSSNASARHLRLS